MLLLDQRKLTLYRIKNPLADLSPHHVIRDVNEFAETHGLTDITPVLQRGALVARDPANYASVEGLTEDESLAIQNEVLHKWKQPAALYFTIILCSIGAAVQ
jgi:hypothetical protein